MRARAGLRAGLALLGVVLAIDLLVFRPAPAGLALGAAGVALVGASAAWPRPWWLVAGACTFCVATAGVDIPRHDTFLAVLFLLAAGAPVVALLMLAPRLEPDAPPRPRFPTRRVVGQAAGVVGAAVLFAALPAAWPPVRDAWASELGPTLAVLLVAGVSLAAFGPLVVDGDREPTRAVAEPLGAAARAGVVRFTARQAVRFTPAPRRRG